MSGTTLERLQVIIEASATKYKKEMDAVAQKTQKQKRSLTAVCPA